MSRLLVPMRYLGLAVALGLFSGGCKPQDAPIPSGSVATITPLEANLGRMLSEDERDVVFAVRNTGDAELLIERVETTCGCMRPRFPKRLAPGEAGEIVVRFVPDIADSGFITEGVKVFTNADKEPTLLKFQVDLEPPVRLSPGTPLVMPVEPGGIAHQILTFTPRPKSGIEVLGLESSSSDVKIEVLPENAARVTVTSRGAGDFFRQLTLRTTHPRMLAFKFTLEMQTTSGPVSEPTTLTMAALSVASKDVPLPSLRVFARDRPVRVLSAEAVAGLAVDVGEPTDTGTTLHVRYTGGWKIGSHRAELVVLTDHPKWPRLRVPIDVTAIE